MHNFYGTTMCVLITTKLSSDLTVEIRKTWGGSRMKWPCRIAVSSQQGFDFVGKLHKHRSQRRDFKLVGWLIAKTATRRWFFFLNFQLWTQILRSKIDQLIYCQTDKIFCFVEALRKWWRRVAPQRRCILCPYNPML